MAEKTITNRTSKLSFDGFEHVSIPVSALIDAPAQEPTGKGVLLMNHRRTVRVLDVKDDNGNPVELTVTFRVERTAMSQSEADSIVNKKAEQSRRAEEKNAKDEKAQQRLIDAVQNTAIKVAQQSKTVDPVADMIQKTIAANVSQMFGGRAALTEGK